MAFLKRLLCTTVSVAASVCDDSSSRLRKRLQGKARRRAATADESKAQRTVPRFQIEIENGTCLRGRGLRYLEFFTFIFIIRKPAFRLGYYCPGRKPITGPQQRITFMSQTFQVLLECFFSWKKAR